MLDRSSADFRECPSLLETSEAFFNRLVPSRHFGEYSVELCPAEYIKPLQGSIKVVEERVCSEQRDG